MAFHLLLTLPAGQHLTCLYTMAGRTEQMKYLHSAADIKGLGSSSSTNAYIKVSAASVLHTFRFGARQGEDDVCKVRHTMMT